MFFKRQNLKISFNKNSKYLILISIFLLILIVWNVYSSIEYSETIIDNRKNDLTITLENFLQHGRISPGTILFGFLTGELKAIFISYGNIHGIDPTLYIGILTLFLFIYGLIANKNDSYFITFASIFLIIFGISIGGYLAELIYDIYYPIRIFRHIGLFFEFGGKFLIISSAIVLDKFILKKSQKNVLLKKNKQFNFYY